MSAATAHELEIAARDGAAYELVHVADGEPDELCELALADVERPSITASESEERADLEHRAVFVRGTSVAAIARALLLEAQRAAFVGRPDK
jgi:hypothetical protein